MGQARLRMETFDRSAAACKYWKTGWWLPAVIIGPQKPTPGLHKCVPRSRTARHGRYPRQQPGARPVALVLFHRPARLTVDPGATNSWPLSPPHMRNIFFRTSAPGSSRSRSS